MNELTSLQVYSLGEQGLLQRLQQFCPPDVVGDDAAVLSVAPEQSLVVTTDVLVDEVHFSDRTTSAQDVGWRAAAVNLSDLAAMGATPLGVTVGLSVPGDTPVVWVEELYQGLTKCLQKYDTAVVGGDVCRSPVISVAIAAFGQVHPAQAIRRSTAQPGYAILVTGVHGSSKAGLELLLHPELGQALNATERIQLIKAHQRPHPRLDVLPILREILDSQISTPAPYPVAGMDSSDGLADAIAQICRASQVGARVDRAQIPISPALQPWLSPEQALEWALYGGEDFELVLCLPDEVAQVLVEKLETGAAIVGKLTPEPEVLLVDATGRYSDEVLALERGFQHF